VTKGSVKKTGVAMKDRGQYQTWFSPNSVPHPSVGAGFAI